MASNQVRKEKGAVSGKALKGSIEARRYEQEGRFTPNNKRRRSDDEKSYSGMLDTQQRQNLREFSQRMNKQAKEVSGDSARREKLAAKRITNAMKKR